jgi:hypothetical protein
VFTIRWCEMHIIYQHPRHPYFQEYTAAQVFHLIYIKGKAVPLQARSDPDGSTKLRFPDCMTTQDGG